MRCCSDRVAVARARPQLTLARSGRPSVDLAPFGRAVDCAVHGGHGTGDQRNAMDGPSMRERKMCFFFARRALEKSFFFARPAACRTKKTRPVFFFLLGPPRTEQKKKRALCSNHTQPRTRQ